MPRIRPYDNPLRDYGTARHDAERFRAWRRFSRAMMDNARIYAADPDVTEETRRLEIGRCVWFAIDGARKSRAYLARLRARRATPGKA